MLYPQLHPIFYLNIFSLPNVDCSYWNVRFTMHKWYSNVQGAQRLAMWLSLLFPHFKNTSLFEWMFKAVYKVQQESIWILFSFKRDLSSCLKKYCKLIFEWILRILVWWASPLFIFSYQPVPFPVINPSAWGHLNPSSYCDVGRLFCWVFKLWSKLCRSLFKIM